MGGAEYFAPLVFAETIITHPGRYLTRSGETVLIDAVSNRHDFNCTGSYSCGRRERWHRSGRLYAGMLSANDIVSRC
jgi:hypothetical protein